MTFNAKEMKVNLLSDAWNEYNDVQQDEGVHNSVTLMRWRRLGYLFAMIPAIIYPLFKISMIAMFQEILREVLHVNIDENVVEKIDDEIYSTIDESPITSAFLLRGLSFYQMLAVVCGYVFVFSISTSMNHILYETFNNYMEVKRLQVILYDKFIIEPNSVNDKEAMELVYNSIHSIEKYWRNGKYELIHDRTTTVWCLVLIFILCWEAGIYMSVATIIIVFGTKSLWKTMSVPWNLNRENKMAAVSKKLMDLVICKDTVLSHSMEKQERRNLLKQIYSDKEDIQHLFWAKGVTFFFQNFAFNFVMPSIFVCVYELDLTLTRVFQLILFIVIQDEMVRAYVASSKKVMIIEEYERAKDKFCRVLNMNKEELFPPDFDFSTSSKSSSKRKVHIAPNEMKQPDMTNGLEVTKNPIVCSKRSDDDDFMTMEENRQHVLLCNASLGYWRKEGTFHSVVKNLDLKLDNGQHYALMGESGAGKSTLLKAVAGLLPLSKGRFSVDGIETGNTSRMWRKQIGMVSQDTVLFNRTLRENLAYGLTGITDEEIYGVLDKVNLKKVFDDLPEGLDMKVEQNGNEFSGGQLQRIQIGRLLLKNSPVILLDEMTSALDQDTKMVILDVLKDFLKGKTLLMVTHDVQALALANQIISMQLDGPIEIKNTNQHDHMLRQHSFKSTIGSI
mmetsp:Transcript_27381/g.31657  ORF Transcript_27381/g.31657 Transcript_27381/m.31657 type:complete len:674 (-) Transcript_27381:183-2204(-)